ncbi:MAG: PSD1 domain-containing protein [Planctomycetaceae bacterium]|nr:PSD1 domain-containing protein [Planctomycetaceae bacterium]
MLMRTSRHSLATVAASIILSMQMTSGRADEQSPKTNRTISFDRDIRPILSNTCYACHGPDEQVRQGGDPELGGLRLDTRSGAFAALGGDRFAVVAGDPATSELVRRIWSTDDSDVMPPADHLIQLTEEQKELLTEWIRSGAEWKEHWAYTRPHRWTPPDVEHGDEVGNWIDRFIVARLQQEGLTPSPAADKRTLIRRLYFDLLGLPPQQHEVDAFLSDENDDAWERLVDRLLDSPHFGERMAIYWLDLVRYADTVGYHGDQDVSVSPYRDYVIRAFNGNMPFDRFTREQLAGDLLKDATQDQKIASGYNRLGMMSAEGGVQPKEYLAKYAADRVRTASVVWLGSTMGCAECHDHKYDPFTTSDFYRFASFFADIKEQGLYGGAFVDGKWGTMLDVTDEELPTLLAPIDAQLRILEQTAATQTAELSAAQQAWEDELRANVTPWELLTPIDVAALHGTELTVLNDASILASGPLGDQNSYTIKVESPLAGITGFRIELLPHESLPKNGPGRAPGGSFVLTELTVERAPSEVDGTPERIALQNAIADFEQTAAAEMNPYKVWNAASVIDGDDKGRAWGWAVSPQEGRSHQLIVEAAAPLSSREESNPALTFRLDQNLDILPNFTIGRFRLWATTAPQPLAVDPLMKLPDDIRNLITTADSDRTEEQQNTLATFHRGISPLLEPVRQQIAELQKERAAVVAAHTRATVVTVAVDPREMRVLPRGNWMDDSGPVTQPGVPEFLPQIEKDARANRLDLAEWITSPENPLTARVMVNRFWKMLFGTGLSKVLDDVGAQGEPPVHPELLDTLAVEFTDGGWDVKSLMKLLVMSATYRQSSLPRPGLREIDPFNRLLARQSRFRLDAELVRDNALAVSGLLVNKVGGRSVKPYQPDGLYRHLNFPPRTYTADTNENQYRRGVYTHWQRQFLHPAMKSFDAPAREECTAERPRSNTPLAALVMLNDPSYVEAARVFAARALNEPGLSEGERIDWIMNHAVARPASEREVEVLCGLLESQRDRFLHHPEAAMQLLTTGLTAAPSDLDPVELAAWTSITRAVFNMHEFITRN